MPDTSGKALAIGIVGVILVAVGLLGIFGIVPFAIKGGGGCTYLAVFTGTVREAGSDIPLQGQVTIAEVSNDAGRPHIMIVRSVNTTSAGTYSISMLVTGGTLYRLTAISPDHDLETKDVTPACVANAPAQGFPIKTDFSLARSVPFEAGFVWSAVNLTVTVSDGSIGGPDGWTWSWGDGSQSGPLGTGTASHTYGHAGTYKITLDAYRSSDGVHDLVSVDVIVTSATGGGSSGSSGSGSTDRVTALTPAEVPVLPIVVLLIGLLLVVLALAVRSRSG
jgi:PKD repeat protein